MIDIMWRHQRTGSVCCRAHPGRSKLTPPTDRKRQIFVNSVEWRQRKGKAKRSVWLQKTTVDGRMQVWRLWIKETNFPATFNDKKMLPNRVLQTIKQRRASGLCFCYGKAGDLQKLEGTTRKKIIFQYCRKMQSGWAVSSSVRHIQKLFKWSTAKLLLWRHKVQTFSLLYSYEMNWLEESAKLILVRNRSLECLTRAVHQYSSLSLRKTVISDTRNCSSYPLCEWRIINSKSFGYSVGTAFVFGFVHH